MAVICRLRIVDYATLPLALRGKKLYNFFVVGGGLRPALVSSFIEKGEKNGKADLSETRDKLEIFD